MGRRTNHVLLPNSRADIREDGVVLKAQYEIRCTRESASAMKHFMEVARRCYEQGRGVMEVKLEMISQTERKPEIIEDIDSL